MPENTAVILTKGKTYTSPFDGSLSIGWSRFGGIHFGPHSVAIKAKAYSTEVSVIQNRTVVLRKTIPYDTWITGTELVGLEGFSVLVTTPVSKGQPKVYIQWTQVTLPQHEDSAELATTKGIASSLLTEQRGFPEAVPDLVAVRPSGEQSCTSCRYHRSATSLVELLILDVGNQAGSGIMPLRNRLLDEETSLEAEQEEEIETLENAVTPGQHLDLQWSRRPSSSSYCGLRETNREWYFEDAKNNDGLCEDMRPQESDVGERVCKTCRHRKDSPEPLIAAIYACLSSLGNAASSLIMDFDRELAALTEFEVTYAFRNVGRLPAPPVTLTMCTRFSSSSKYVVGPCINPEGRCGDWVADREPHRLSEQQLAALALWQSIEGEQAAIEGSEAAVDRALQTNIFLVPTSSISKALGSEGHDKKKVQFLSMALPAVGVPSGKASMMAALADKALHDERRMPYFPPS